LTSVFYTSSQTIVIPPGVISAQVSMWGASGGSGGVTNACSGATGAGGYLEKFLTGLTPGNTLIFTQGVGGAAGAAGSGTGGNATATTLMSGTQAISALTCNGSNGTIGANNVFTQGSVGGTATGGDFNVTGQSGAPGNNTGGAARDIAPGGMTFFAKGADGADNTAVGPGIAGSNGGLRIVWIT
jgi:hypothetical protein